MISVGSSAPYRVRSGCAAKSRYCGAVRAWVRKRAVRMQRCIKNSILFFPKELEVSQKSVKLGTQRVHRSSVKIRVSVC